jgi:hypothetical protein
MIYLFSTTHIQSKRESYLKYQTISLSLYDDDDDSQTALFSSSFAFFFSSNYRYNRNEKVCIYVSVGFQDDENESNACFMYEKYFILSQREEKKGEKTCNVGMLLK